MQNPQNFSSFPLFSQKVKTCTHHFSKGLCTSNQKNFLLCKTRFFTLEHFECPPIEVDLRWPKILTDVSALHCIMNLSCSHSGMFCKVLFRFENDGRQRNFANFWHFLTWIQSFFKPIEFLGLNKVNWVENKPELCSAYKRQQLCLICYFDIWHLLPNSPFAKFTIR